MKSEKKYLCWTKARLEIKGFGFQNMQSAVPGDEDDDVEN